MKRFTRIALPTEPTPDAPDTPAWVRDAVFYQIFPDRFAASDRVHKPGRLEPWESPPTTHGFKGGDLLGIVEHLDYLQELGITAIYLNPIFASASNHRYHTYDYFQVDPLLGGNEALAELLQAAHSRGIRVILDGVFNHASRGFWPFHHILECGPQSPYLDWFIIHDFPLHPYDEKKPANYAAWWDLRALPKLNVANPDTRAYLLDVAEHWIRFGADGWRLDVPDEIDDPDFWRAFRRRVRAANPEAYTVGEIWKPAPEWLAGDRFDALMNYPLALTLLGFVAQNTLRRDLRPGGYRLRPFGARQTLARLTELFSLYHPHVVYSQLNLLDSHDTPRFLTMAGGDYSALHLAIFLVMTLPGAPCLFYGSEVGLEGGPDPDCRRAFPWDRERWHHATWALTRRAIALRHEHAALRYGSFEPLYGHKGVLAFLRRGAGEAVLVVVNVGAEDTARAIPLPSDLPVGDETPVDLWGNPADDLPPQWGRGEGGSRPLTVPVAARHGRVLGWTIDDGR